MKAELYYYALKYLFEAYHLEVNDDTLDKAKDALEYIEKTDPIVRNELRSVWGIGDDWISLNF